jgi:choline dehydrogenase
MQTYDFIVVGSGSAGSVLAERLSASGRFSVLVLEAGGTDRRFYVQMPLGYGKTFFDPAVNWNYKAEPDPGLGNNIDHWPRGKLLGGSSSINAMVWIRGAREDFDAWAAAGNPGWSFDDLLPAFKALEDNQAGADQWRGVGGPLHITDCSNSVHPLTKRYLAAATQAGLPLNPDFNGASQEGVGIYQITTRNGRRMSAARAFLRPAMQRKNVRVEVNALATRVLFEGKRAVGIEYLQNGETRTARAGREVILSGGSINSPQLLQLSGVGPSALLGALGIPVVHANENVGANLQDHVGINYTFKGQLPTLNQILRPWWGKLMVGMQYILMRSGPLSLSMNNAGAFTAQHAALFPGVLDRHPEKRRAPDPDARSVAGLFHRPVQLPPVEPRRDHDPLRQSARLSQNRRQRLFDRGGRDRDAGGGEVREENRLDA